MSATPQLRQLVEADLPLAMDLKLLAGWNQTEADWRRFLWLCPEGCFVAAVDGRDCGTAVATIFDGKVGWIAMILVHPDLRRRGLGTALMGACIEFLRGRGISSIKLDATPAGKPVYELLGFVDEYQLERRQGTGRAYAQGTVTTLTPSDLGPVLALDREVCGVGRGNLLRRIAEENPSMARVCRSASGDLRGYAMVRPGSSAWHVAPCVATAADAGAQLLRATLAGCLDEPVLLDLVLENPDAAALADELGFTFQRPFTRMYFGENPWPGRPELVYATSGPEKG